MKMRWTALLFVAILLAATACNTLAGRSPVIDRIRESGKLRVGMAGDYPPLNLLDRGGRNVGLEPDLARALAKTMGVELEVVAKPFAELIPALESGDVDAVMSGLTMTPERNMNVAFAGPYFISGKAILSRSETLARINSPEQLNRPTLRLVALAGTTSEGFVREAVPSADLTTAASYAEAVRLVIDGSVDAMIADYPICVVSVLQNPGAGLSAVLAPFTFEPIGVALPANDALFINLVENYLKSLEGTGLLDQLRSNWFDDSSWLELLPSDGGLHRAPILGPDLES